MNDAPVSAVADVSTSAVPSVDRAWQLLEWAVVHDEAKVLGWADDGVMQPFTGRLTFSVDDRVTSPCGHEDMVVVVAFRVPHPDYATLDQVLDENHPLFDPVVEPCRGCESTTPGFHTLVCPLRWEDWNRD